VLLPLLLSIVEADNLNKITDTSIGKDYLVPGKYRFCPSQEIDKICELPRPRNDSIRTSESRKILKDQLTFTKNEKKFVHLDLYKKVLNSVSGIGYECTQVRNQLKFNENIILNRFKLSWKEHVQLTDLDYKECGRNKGKMDFINKICSYKEEIKPEYSWGQSLIKSGDECLFREKTIIEVDKNSLLLGTNEDGFTSDEKNLNFIYKANEDWCSTKIMTTVERVYIKFAVYSKPDDMFYKHTGIEESTDQVDLKQIAELTLASPDFDLKIETDLARKEFEQSCQNFKVILEVF